MQAVFNGIESLKERIKKLLEDYKKTKLENIALKESIRKLESQLQENKNHIKTTEDVEKEVVVEELSKYITEIDELIKILS